MSGRQENKGCEILALGQSPGGEHRGRARVRQVDEVTFVIEPFSEDNDRCYKFRLDIKVSNNSATPKELFIIIDWHDEEYIQYRDEIFLRHDKSNWDVTVAKLENGKSIFRWHFLPGETYMTLNPKYDYKDLNKFIGTLPENDFVKVDVLGETESGHNIFIVNVSDKSNVIRKKNILITARTHPYETAGSYCIEGMIDFFLRNEKSFQLLRKANFFFMPMLCPDGVQQGCCKLSEIDGIDFARYMSENYQLSNVYTRLIDKVMPDLFLELHNWMLKDRDGLFYLNFYDSYYLQYLLKRGIPRHIRKTFIAGLDRLIFKRPPGGLKKYAQEKCGTKVMTAEFGWHGRNVENMKEIGKILLQCIQKIF